MPKVLTPCVGVCVIEPASNLCEGCGRTLDEIAGWGAMSDPRRRSVMKLLGARLRRLRAERAARLPGAGR